jgi:hypothetical protein
MEEVELDQLDTAGLNTKLMQAVFHWTYYGQAKSEFGKAVDISYQRELSNVIKFGMETRHLELEIVVTRDKVSEENKKRFFPVNDASFQEAKLVIHEYFTATQVSRYPAVAMPDNRITLKIVFDANNMAILQPSEVESMQFIESSIV